MHKVVRKVCTEHAFFTFITLKLLVKTLLTNLTYYLMMNQNGKFYY